MNAPHRTAQTLRCAALASLLLAPAGYGRSVGCRIEVDRSVIPADTPATAILKITLDAPEAPPASSRTPVNLCIVLDRSSSMSGSRIEHARAAAIEAVRRLRPDDLVSLVTYDSAIETVIPAGHPGDREWIESQILAISPRGMTALFGGVGQGAAELRKHLDGRYVHRMILLSDGQANVGPNTPEDLGRLGDSLLKENIHVSTIGVGLGYNEDLMTRLALRAGGNTYFAEDSADLPRILGSELGEAQRVVAQRVMIEVNLPPGVEALRIIGREGQIRRGRIEVPLHQLHGGQSRYALVEVSLPPQAPEARLEIARARVAYEDVARQRRVVTPEQPVSVSFSRRAEEIAASANRRVQVELLYNERALAQEEAIRLSDEGRTREAAAVMRKVAEDYSALAEQMPDEPLAPQASVLRQQADQLESKGLDTRGRKTFRAESYQIINQQ